MRFICYSNWNELPESACGLFESAQKISMFFSRPWYENLVTTALAEGHEMLLACVQNGDSILAVLPLKKHDSGSWHSLTHLYSSLYTRLVDEKDDLAIIQCLVDGLKQLPFSTIRIEPVAEDDSNILRLQQVMKSSGFYAERYYRFYNWYHRVEGQLFEDYMAARPAKVRNTIARKQRKLMREHGYKIRLYIDKNIEQGLADYNSIYRDSWKAHEQFSEVLEGLVRQFADEGWLRLAVLYAHGKPAAAQLWFVVERKASVFRLAYNEEWKRYSPGSILTGYLMKQVIDVDKVEEIDYLTGNEAYKQDWMTQRRQRWGLHCAKPQQAHTGFIQRLTGSIKYLIAKRKAS